jgi:Fe-S oxidoreductase
LMCKACKAECPSNVDMAKLKAEFLEFYYQDRPRPLGQLAMARIHQLNRLGSMAAPLVNWLQRRRSVRWLMEKVGGVDRRRSLPSLHRNHFRRWFRRHTVAPGAGTRGRVMLLDDCFTTFNEPHVGKAAVDVLERAGYAVELAGIACCGRPMISKGFLHEARTLIQQVAPRLERRLADGVPLLGLEPSCILTLADEWPELVPTVEAKRIALAADLADSWLGRQLQEKRSELALAPRSEKCLLHGHCHQKALQGDGGTAGLLRQVPQLKLSVLDAGCCGMAGSFGYEKEHYDVSVKIANLALVPAIKADAEALIVAPGTSCRHQIKDLTGRRALHPMELLAQAMKSE